MATELSNLSVGYSAKIGGTNVELSNFNSSINTYCVRVLDKDSNPLSNVTVIVEQGSFNTEITYSITTDSNGEVYVPYTDVKLGFEAPNDLFRRNVDFQGDVNACVEIQLLFKRGEAIRNDGSNWVRADGTIEAEYSDPPSVITGCDENGNYQYNQEGIFIVDFNLGNIGDVFYADITNGCTTIEQGNPVYRIIDEDSNGNSIIQIASPIGIYSEGALKQYNWKKDMIFFHSTLSFFNTLSTIDTNTSATYANGRITRGADIQPRNGANQNLYVGNKNSVTGKLHKYRFVFYWSGRVGGDVQFRFQLTTGNTIIGTVLTTAGVYVYEGELIATNSTPPRFGLRDLDGDNINTFIQFYEVEIYEVSVAPIEKDESYGVMNGWTVDDLGLENRVTALAQQDFYPATTSSGIPSIVKLNIAKGIGQNVQFPVTLNDALSVTGELSILLEYQSVITGGSDLFFLNLVYTPSYAYFRLASDSFQLFTSDGSGAITITGIPNLDKKPLKILFKWTGGNLLSVYYQVRGQNEWTLGVTKINPYVFNNTNTRLTTQNRNNDLFVYHYSIHSRDLPLEEASSLQFTQDPHQEMKLGIGNSLVVADKNNNTYTLAQPQKLIDGGVGWLEQKSDYPPIVQGLRIQNIKGGGTTDQYIELDRTISPTDDFTLFFNSKSLSVNPNLMQFLSLVGGTGDILNVYRLSDNTLFTAFPDASTSITISLEETILKFSWCLTRKGDVYTLFFNGVKISSRTLSYDLSNLSRFRLSWNDAAVPANQIYYSFGYWTEALDQLDIIHLHNNNKLNNPWINLPSNYNKAMQDSLVLWHQFQGNPRPLEGEITGSFSNIDIYSPVEVKNWADDSGATNSEYVEPILELQNLVESSSVWSFDVLASGIQSYDIEFFDVTNNQVLATATDIPSGTDLSIDNGWLNFNSPQGLLVSDFSSNTSSTGLPYNGLDIFSFNFSNFTNSTLSSGYPFIDNIRITLTPKREGVSLGLAKSVELNESTLSFDFTMSVTSGDTITLPNNSTNSQIDWGDGTNTRGVSNASHTYTSTGTFNLRILGTSNTFTWDSANATARSALQSIEQWGDLSINSNLLLRNCGNLTTLPTGPITGADAITSLNSVFAFSGLTAIPSGLFDNMSNLTDVSSAFLFTNITTIPSGLFDNNALITTFFQTFRQCPNLTTIPSGLFDNNVSATNFSTTFLFCNSLTGIPQDLFINNVNVVTYDSAFLGCSSITTDVPELWLDTYYVTTPTGYNLVPPDYDSGGAGTPRPQGRDCFQGCSSATNFGTIPIHWK